MEGILALLVPFGVFLMVFGIVYVVISASNKEKLSMLDKGFTPQEIADASYKTEDPKKRLSIGLIAVGVALGIIIGFFLSQHYPIKPKLAYVTCAFLFGGIGSILSYFLTKGNENQ
jgi:hypothetical protein